MDKKKDNKVATTEPVQEVFMENPTTPVENNEVDILKEQVTKLDAEIKDLTGKVKMSQAELINYRKRKDDEVSSMLKYANEDIMKELIGVVDNFERAISLDDNDLTDELSKFLSGFKLMYGTLDGILKISSAEEF